MVGRLLVLTVIFAGGCRVTGVFVCARDDQCLRGTATGRCEPIGYCSFPDGMCMSGSRYVDSAGDGYAGACVGDEMLPVDAAIDSPPSFDVSQCPSDYNVMIASTMTTSRYRLIATQGMYWPHAADCNDDLAGATHPATPNAQLEIVELSQYVLQVMSPETTFYVGAVQDPTAATPGAGWILFDGSPVPSNVWLPGEPDDEDDVENQGYQLAFFDSNQFFRRMFDSSGMPMRGVVCECDGIPIAPMAQQFIDTDPNNPN